MSKKRSLGRSLIKSKRKKRQKQLSERHTVNDLEAPSEFVSVLDQTDIETFMDKMDMQRRTKYVQRHYEYEEVMKLSAPKLAPNGSFELPVPQRPPWQRGKTTKKQLQNLEEEEFLSWRRNLADLGEQYILSPFERNPNVWRQLWRVVEKSDIVFQIVDARNPLLFRSTVLESMAKMKRKNKKVYLILNKSDLLNESQRRVWSEALTNLGVTFFFFSAVDEMEEVLKVSSKVNKLQCQEEIASIPPQTRNEEDLSYVYSRKELLGILKSYGEENIKNFNEILTKKKVDTDHHYLSSRSKRRNRRNRRKNRFNNNNENNHRIVLEQAAFKIGMIGYPNVGKSSLINVLSGLVRVSVAATPGKTKYMQTVNLCPGLILYDCPGLVFPTIGSSQAEMVCNGILPIDRLRYRVIEPVSFLCKRIPKEVLELTYGIKIKCKNGPRIVSIPRIPDEEEGEGEEEEYEDIENITEDEVKLNFVTAREFLESFCEEKSMMTQSQMHNIPQASRIVLKDYVSGKLLYVHPPPDTLLEMDEELPEMKDEVEMEDDGNNDNENNNNNVDDDDLEKFFEKKMKGEREHEEDDGEEENKVIINLDHGEGGKMKRKWRRKGPSQEEIRAGLMFNEGNVGIMRLMQRVGEREEERRIRKRRRKQGEDNQVYVIMDETGEKVSVQDYKRREKNKKFKEKMARIKGLSKQQVRMLKRDNML